MFKLSHGVHGLGKEATMKCTNCEQDMQVASYTVQTNELKVAELCSPSCLVEWAWKEKDAQQKLNKSRLSEWPEFQR